MINRSYNIRENPLFVDTTVDRLRVFEQEIIDALGTKVLVLKDVRDVIEIVIPASDSAPTETKSQK